MALARQGLGAFLGIARKSCTLALPPATVTCARQRDVTDVVAIERGWSASGQRCFSSGASVQNVSTEGAEKRDEKAARGRGRRQPTAEAGNVSRQKDTAKAKEGTPRRSRRREQNSREAEGERGSLKPETMSTLGSVDAKQSASLVGPTGSFGPARKNEGKPFGARGRGSGRGPSRGRPGASTGRRALRGSSGRSMENIVLKTDHISTGYQEALKAQLIKDVALDVNSIIEKGMESASLPASYVEFIQKAARDVEVCGRYKPADQMATIATMVSRLKSIEETSWISIGREH